MSAIVAEGRVAETESQNSVAYEVSLDTSKLRNQPKQRRNLQKRLQTAFTTFNDISQQLTSSYQELENRIGELQDELAQSDQARMREYSAREALAERFNVLLNAMPVAVVLLDGRGVVAKANAIAEALLQKDLAGKPWLDVINQCFSPKPADGHEVLLNNGKLVSIATQSLSNEPGQIIVLSDQTEARLLQKKLNHNRKLSEMGKMTASLAHQIRTPLSTATLYADHLGSTQLSEERRVKYASKLKERLVQLEKQVRDMLIFSKGGIVLNSIETVENLLGVFQAQSNELAQQKGASILWSSAQTSGLVRCNLDLLLSVFANLMDNAIEACVANGVDPEIKVIISADKKDFVHICLCDNGPGIPQDIQNRITEPFYTTKATGTGLGLAVANAVIEAHGGYFQIFNLTQGGACARMSLPLSVDVEAAKEEKEND